MVKKILISVLFVGAFGAYVLYSFMHRPQAGAAAAVATSSAPATTAAANPSAVSGATPATAASTGEYADGTYTGSVANAFYGNIQVQATISGGKLTKVAFLQYPDDRPQSIQINTQAMPILAQQAIQAQSAQVDGVSSASQSSAAFEQSLGSALEQAKA